MVEEFISTVQVEAEANSLDFLQACYRNPSLPLTTRMRAAIAALPHEVPKLAVTAVLSREEDYAALFDARHKRAVANGFFEIEPRRVIEHQPEERPFRRRV